MAWLQTSQSTIYAAPAAFKSSHAFTKESDVDIYLTLVKEAQSRADVYEKLFDDPATSVDVLAREKALLREAQRDLLQSPIAQLPPETQRQVLETRRERKQSRESPDWRSFVAITSVLRKFDAIDGDNTVTQLGAKPKKAKVRQS